MTMTERGWQFDQWESECDFWHDTGRTLLGKQAVADHLNALEEALAELLDVATDLADYHSHDFDDGGTFAKARAALAKAQP